MDSEVEYLGFETSLGLLWLIRRCELGLTTLDDRKSPGRKSDGPAPVIT